MAFTLPANLYHTSGPVYPQGEIKGSLRDKKLILPKREEVLPEKIVNPWPKKVSSQPAKPWKKELGGLKFKPFG